MNPGDRYISLTFNIWEEAGMFAAECVELGTATCGDTFEEARENLFDAIGLHLNVLEEEGERPPVFREKGIRVQTYTKSTRPRAATISVRPGTWASRERVVVPA